MFSFRFHLHVRIVGIIIHYLINKLEHSNNDYLYVKSKVKRRTKIGETLVVLFMIQQFVSIGQTWSPVRYEFEPHQMTPPVRCELKPHQMTPLSGVSSNPHQMTPPVRCEFKPHQMTPLSGVSSNPIK